MSQLKEVLLRVQPPTVLGLYRSLTRQRIVLQRLRGSTTSLPFNIEPYDALRQAMTDEISKMMDICTIIAEVMRQRDMEVPVYDHNALYAEFVEETMRQMKGERSK